MTARTFNRYIARQFIVSLVVINGGFAVLIFLAAYLWVLQRSGASEGFTPLIGAQLALLRVPLVIDTALPFAVLHGTLFCLLSLSRRFELAVARASGVSVWGFLRPPLVIALLFGAAATMFLNPLAVDLRGRADVVEAELNDGPQEGEGWWFRQESDRASSIVYAGAADNNGLALFGITAFVFDPNGDFREKVSAPRADHAGDRWILTDAKVVPADSASRLIPRYELPTDLSALEVSRTFIDPSAISVWSLPSFIDTAERAGVEPERFQVAFHTLLSRPLFLAAMVIIAATVGLRLGRSGGAWRLAFIGAAIGFVLFAVTDIVSDLGGSGIISPILAAWLPPLAGLTFGATVLLHQEDG
jgi:lipopolysaccharide export system permease protein